MIRGIDHLVIVSPDPDAAASELASSVGVSVTGGGRHEGMGTFNRIAWLADGSYIEIVGVEDRDAAARSWLAPRLLDILDAGGGLVSFALLDDDIELTVSALSGAGSAIGPVTHGTRRRPDGELVEWWTAMPDRAIGGGGLPFLIQHAYVGAEWGAGALEERTSFTHPVGSPVILVRLDLATHDPPDLAAVYHEQLGLEFWAVSDLAVCTIGRHTIRLVPSRAMEVPAIVTLGAHIEVPRTAEALGLRVDVERVELPLPTPNRA